MIGVDLEPDRLERARAYGVDAIDVRGTDVVEAIRERTMGRGTDSVIDAVGMEAHGSPVASVLQKAAGLLPDRVAAEVTLRMGVDRLEGLLNSISAVRRGGTLSVIGVYGGAIDPMPMMEMFDKGIQIRMGQAHVRRWVDDLMPLVLDDTDPLGTVGFATHHLPLEEAPAAYQLFQKKRDGVMKVILHP